MRQTRLGHSSDMIGHDSDTTRTQPNTFFFSIIGWTKKEFKGPKTQFHLGILFEVSTEIIPHIF